MRVFIFIASSGEGNVYETYASSNEDYKSSANPIARRRLYLPIVPKEIGRHFTVYRLRSRPSKILF